jgi:hypothetical protein
MITYSTNWMGPASIDWFKNQGLTRVVTKNFGNETLTYDEITENWIGGRIDVYGTGDPYNQEIGLPIMRDDDYGRFSKWLSGIRTEKMLSLDELVSMYEQDNAKIIWWKEKK